MRCSFEPLAKGRRPLAANGLAAIQRAARLLLVLCFGTALISCTPKPPPLPADVEVIRNVEYGTGGGQTLRMHLLRPRALPAEPLPVLVFVGGMSDYSLPSLARLVQRGYVCAAIEFRIGDQAPFPAPLEDCKCAVRFLRAKAPELCLNPDRIGICGFSAGGHLAALVGTTGGIKELEGQGGWPDYSSRVQAVVDWFGLSAYLRMVPDADFVKYVTPDDPPFLIMHGDRDPVVPIEVSERLHTALNQAGVETIFKVVPGAGHGGPAFSRPEYTNILDIFLDRYLKPHLQPSSPPTPRDESRRN